MTGKRPEAVTATSNASVLSMTRKGSQNFNEPKRVGDMTEHQIQAGVVNYLRWLEKVTGKFVFFHPNSTNSNPRYSAKLKALGQRAGVPDLILIFAGKLLLIELKAKGGRLSPVQREFHNKLFVLGFETHTITADTPKQALDQIIPLLRANGVQEAS